MTTTSTLVSSDGLLTLVTQGATGGLLVAGKQCLFRMYLDQFHAATVARVVIDVTRPGSLPSISLILTQGYFTKETVSPHGPSIGAIVRGYAFPRSGTYQVTIWLQDALGVIVASSSFPLVFSPTKDLRLVVVPIQGSAPTHNFLATPEWYADIDAAMQRLGAMLPVRDCVKKGLNGTRKQGLRYHVGAPKEAWPAEVGLPPQDYEAESKAINAAAAPNQDTVDCTITYRPAQTALDEMPGGIAGYCGPPRWGHVVGGAWGDVQLTAPAMAHEIGHTLCLEPAGSPWNVDGHSNAGEISDPLAYDLLLRRPYPESGRYLGDVMSWGLWQGADSVLYSHFDWNHLVTSSLAALNSTGSEVNPAVTNPCGPRPWLTTRETPRTPNNWTQVIGSLVDGPHWQLGPHGPVPGPVGPLDRSARQSASIRTLVLELRRLRDAGIDDVYLPLVDRPLDIAVMFRPSLHARATTDLVSVPRRKRSAVRPRSRARGAAREKQR